MPDRPLGKTDDSRFDRMGVDGKSRFRQNFPRSEVLRRRVPIRIRSATARRPVRIGVRLEITHVRDRLGLVRLRRIPDKVKFHQVAVPLLPVKGRLQRCSFTVVQPNDSQNSGRA